MILTFLDASALFAGVCSTTGAAHAILQMAEDGIVDLVVSEDIVEETVRNIARKIPKANDALLKVLTKGPLRYVEPNEEEMAKADKVTVQKDVPVIAGALASGASYIVSHDRAHLVGNVDIEDSTGIKVVTPGDMLAIIRSFQAEIDEEHNSEKTE